MCPGGSLGPQLSTGWPAQHKQVACPGRCHSKHQWLPYVTQALAPPPCPRANNARELCPSSKTETSRTSASRVSAVRDVKTVLAETAPVPVTTDNTPRQGRD